MVPSPSAYDRIGFRIQRIITHPSAQKVQSATVSRCPGEPEPEWSRLVHDLQSVEGIHVHCHDDGSVTIGWEAYCDT
ncbi:DUF1654 domain-containing protein [Pseudomonas sp. LJDD11]|uniref:DUF1654 domain-containing protein n=1 Tax=unclassified Pseudomonas TaxID=196821 RepID=UPI00211D0784|nr:DUF1654 domain-containing protein [Pseudomonas sp. LJDD11]MCQ9426707.1 DUF1654 domain-containing protein [Pseudomonas sp. LJDD11]